MARHHSPVSGRLVGGAIVILIGLIFLLNNLGIVDARSVFRLWPLVFVLIGLHRIVQSRSASHVFVGLIFICAGSILTLHSLGMVFFAWHRWWPIILILVGIGVLSRAWSGFRQGGPLGGSTNFEQDDSVVNTTAFLGGSHIKNMSRTFKGGSLTAVMGGVELDLRRASIETEAVVDIFAFWGGVDIKIPTDWNVIIEAAPILGGFDDKTVHPDDPAAKRLIIKGYTIMGGAGIMN